MNIRVALCHKNDTEYEESEGHPNLTNAREPRTMKAHESVQKTRKSCFRSKLGTSPNAVHTNDDHVLETTNVDKAKEAGQGNVNAFRPTKCRK